MLREDLGGALRQGTVGEGPAPAQGLLCLDTRNPCPHPPQQIPLLSSLGANQGLLAECPRATLIDMFWYESYGASCLLT